jgi:aspartyl-tRNA(Asn)/glutamyl-tRNA(Gln) amidotransferase subunit A
MGLDSNALPMGLQIQGRPFSEGTILKLADAFQRSTNHHRKLPPMLS